MSYKNETRRRYWSYCAAGLAAMLLAVPISLASGPIFDGDDVWATPCGGGAYALLGQGVAPLIPAGFFDPGSLPFDGVVELGGNPLSLSQPTVPFPSDVDTIVRRTGHTPTLTCGGSEMVAIEIVALDLVSCDPITVRYSNGSNELWDVQVCLSGAPQVPGTMTINHECDNGGTYSSSLPVDVIFTFVRQGDLAVRGPVGDTVTMTSSGWWSHTSPAGVFLSELVPGTIFDSDCDGLPDSPTINTIVNFFPGLYAPDCTDCGSNGTFQKFTLTPEQARWAAHGVYPSNQEKASGGNGGEVITEACCLPDESCVDVDPAECVALWGGTPRGPGSKCPYVECRQPDIPTVSEWGLILLGVLVLGAGAIIVSRRRDIQAQ